MIDSIQGLVVAVLAGVIGSFTLVPMKFVRGWPWAAAWFTYAALAYFLFPWITAALTIPSLPQVYQQAGWSAAAQAATFGVLWGIGVVLYGLAVERVGLSMTAGIILGLSIAIGSLAPLVAGGSHQQLSSEAITKLLAADAVILTGLFTCIAAAHRREKDKAASAAGHGDHRRAKSEGASQLWLGLAMCLISGASAPLVNIALSLGKPITDAAIAHGASKLYQANAVWALTISAGALPSLAYCAVLLGRSHDWGQFRQEVTPRNVGWCVLMGSCFMGSTVLYGAATSLMNESVALAVGWPVYIATIILGGNLWGWWSGEWRGASLAAGATMLLGVLLQIVGIAALNWVN